MRVFAIVLLSLAACGAEETTLAVSLRTDLRAGLDFERIELVVSDATASSLATGSAVGRFEVEATADYLEGVRLADVLLVPGDYVLHLRLLTRDGWVVAERPVLISVPPGSATVATVVITHDCRGVVCDSEGPRACLSGQCVDARCTPETPAFCESPEDDVAMCGSDDDCAALDGGCTRGRCVEGSCFAEADDAGCSEGEQCDPATRVCEAVEPDCGLPPLLCRLFDCTRRTREGDRSYVFCREDAGAFRDVCREGGTTVAPVPDAETDQWLRRTADDLEIPHFFIGGRVDDVEGPWFWPDGQVFWEGGPDGMAPEGAYANWAAGEPLIETSDTGAFTHCVIVGSDSFWRPSWCGAGHGFVCALP